MSFGRAISTCFRKYVTFTGRASRSEYWYFLLFGVLLSIPASIIDSTLATTATPGMRPVGGLLTLVLFLPRLSAAVRRLHDVNRSGWWIGGLFLFLLVFAAVGIFNLFQPVTTSPNTPLAIGAVISSVLMLVWLVWLFVLTVLKGTDGPNRYGEDPLGSGTADVFN
jgi:uncharacterized membrane protein YhaH (DUF805 family)